MCCIKQTLKEMIKTAYNRDVQSIEPYFFRHEFTGQEPFPIEESVLYFGRLRLLSGLTPDSSLTIVTHDDKLILVAQNENIYPFEELLFKSLNWFCETDYPESMPSAPGAKIYSTYWPTNNPAYPTALDDIFGLFGSFPFEFWALYENITTPFSIATNPIVSFLTTNAGFEMEFQNGLQINDEWENPTLGTFEKGIFPWSFDWVNNDQASTTEPLRIGFRMLIANAYSVGANPVGFAPGASYNPGAVMVGPGVSIEDVFSETGYEFASKVLANSPDLFKPAFTNDGANSFWPTLVAHWVKSDHPNTPSAPFDLRKLPLVEEIPGGLVIPDMATEYNLDQRWLAVFTGYRVTLAR